MIWLLGRLVPGDKVIADFRKDNGAAIRKVCVRFVALCRQMGLLTLGGDLLQAFRYFELRHVRLDGECIDPKDRPKWPGSRRLTIRSPTLAEWTAPTGRYVFRTHPCSRARQGRRHHLQPAYFFRRRQ